MQASCKSSTADSADHTKKQHGGEVIELHAFDDQRAQSDALAKAVGDAL
ncbi:MAG: 6-phosphogluconolactonase, partial [Paraburkholderia nemoris]